MKQHILFALALAANAFGTEDDIRRELARIAAVPNDVERLAAFDAYANRLGVAPGTKQAITGKGKWTVSVDTSPVDDSQTVTARLDADAPVKSRFGEDTPVMILRYKEGRLDAYIIFDSFLGSEETECTVRFGKNIAMTQRWGISTDHKAVFAPDAAQFMQRLQSVDSFLIRLTPYGESPVTASFSVAGVSAAVEAINKVKR